MPLFGTHPEIKPTIELSDDRKTFHGEFTYKEIPGLGSGNAKGAVPVEQVIAVAGGEEELRKLDPNRRAARLSRAFVLILVSIPILGNVIPISRPSSEDSNTFIAF